MKISNSKIFKIFAAVLIVGFLFSQVGSVFAQENVTSGDSNATGEDFLLASYGYVPPGANGENVMEKLEEQNKKNGLLYMIAGFAGTVLTFVSGLIDMAIDFGNKVANQQIVLVGFETVLGIANLGFVLAIIIMAFATIFRLESYAMKQTLQKLVIAALLVNFSMVIAEAFINFSNVFSNYFMEGFNNGSIGDALGNLVQPQRLGEVAGPGPGIKEWVFHPIDTTVKIFASLAFVTTFTLLMILVFLALSVMLLIRGIVLAFLLISMPLAWLASIFPYTAQYWKKWWTEFIRWTFFAPIVLFFIYIITSTGAKLGDPNTFFKSGESGASGVSINVINDNNSALAEANNAVNGRQPGWGVIQPGYEAEYEAKWLKSDSVKAFEGSTVLPEGIMGYLSQLIIVLGLLVGGLFMANSLGITGAKAAYGAAKGMTTNLGKWAGKLPLRAGAAAARGTSLGQKITGAGNKLKGKPGAGMLARWTGAGLSGLGGAIQKGQQYKSPGLFKSLLSGAKSGSGLFKKKEKTKDWECQNCGNIARSSKKPSGNCNNCGSAAAVANWKEV